ncbi:MAG: PilZ domain-containing protein [Lysobacterales bacterium]
MGNGHAVEVRHARMPTRTPVLLSSGGATWNTETRNISATGVLVRRPRNWQGRVGDGVILDLLVRDGVDIHLEARAARLTADEIGLEYTWVPARNEVALWSFLGAYADRVERRSSAGTARPGHPEDSMP